jgi:hypothetical protein
VSVYIYHCVLNRNEGKGRRDRVEIGAPSGPVGTVDRESCADGNSKAQDCIKIPEDGRSMCL